MSTNDPGQPEYLGSGPDHHDGPDGHHGADGPDGPDGSGRRRGRRTAVIAAAAVAVAAVGAGAYGVGQFMSHGSSAASAIPADAVAYASLDLDPSAAQKIEAIKIYRKFPGLRSELNIGSSDDLRQTIVERIVKESGCTSVDYDSDVKPWIGDRLAVAAVPKGASDVVPLVALQVTDEKKAEQGVRTLEKCDSGDATPVGVAFVGDYMLLTEKKADADRMAASADSSSLEDDAGFTTWMDRVGDPGIISMYASKDAAARLIAHQKAKPGGLSGRSGDTTPDQESKQLETAFKGFEGGAGAVRFKDGAVEAEFTAKGLGGGAAPSTPSGPDVTTLPATTGAVLSIALQDGWLDTVLANAKGGVGGSALDGLLSQGEAATGLQLPQDIETLLGDGFDVSVDAGADLQALRANPDPSQVPAGIRIKGDTTKIIAIIDKLKRTAGPAAALLQVQSKNGVVAVGTDKAYVAKLLATGSLGDTDAFTTVVPDADRASAVLYVNFDAGNGWAERLADLLSPRDPSVKANVKPLDSLGISSWQDKDKVQHSLLRLTTD